MQRKIWCIDTHTAGEPTRIVVSPLPIIWKGSVAQARESLKDEHDNLRRALIWEPRGHRDMFGAVILPPSDPEADLGVVFMDGSGYLSMCIHGSIGTVTAALETGFIEMHSPVTEVTLETPSGIVKASATIDGSKVKEVTIRNVPSFLYDTGSIDIPGIGRITVDIAFGGNFFAIVDAKELKVTVAPESYDQLVRIGLAIMHEANNKFQVAHPVNKHIQSIDLVEICTKPSDPRAHSKNATVFGRGQIDRSPCGTGTCAKMAALHAKGRLGLGEEFINEGILGTSFRGRLLATTRVGEFKAVVPEVTGSAYITAFCQFVFDSSDPFSNGFLL